MSFLHAMLHYHLLLVMVALAVKTLYLSVA